MGAIQERSWRRQILAVTGARLTGRTAVETCDQSAENATLLRNQHPHPIRVRPGQAADPCTDLDEGIDFGKTPARHPEVVKEFRGPEAGGTLRDIGADRHDSSSQLRAQFESLLSGEKRNEPIHLLGELERLSPAYQVFVS